MRRNNKKRINGRFYGLLVVALMLMATGIFAGCYTLFGNITLNNTEKLKGTSSSSKKLTLNCYTKDNKGNKKS